MGHFLFYKETQGPCKASNGFIRIPMDIIVAKRSRNRARIGQNELQRRPKGRTSFFFSFFFFFFFSCSFSAHFLFDFALFRYFSGCSSMTEILLLSTKSPEAPKGLIRHSRALIMRPPESWKDARSFMYQGTEGHMRNPGALRGFQGLYKALQGLYHRGTFLKSFRNRPERASKTPRAL